MIQRVINFVASVKFIFKFEIIIVFYNRYTVRVLLSSLPITEQSVRPPKVFLTLFPRQCRGLNVLRRKISQS